MTDFKYSIAARDKNHATLGLIVLQSDETIEDDFRQLLPRDDVTLHISRVPSRPEVTRDTLAEMRDNLPPAAALFPRASRFATVGYGCTSGTSVIGASTVAELIKSECATAHVTEPVSALTAACAELGIKRLAFLSPYIEEVSIGLRKVLGKSGIETPVFGSFNEAMEAKVVQINGQSVKDAAVELGRSNETDAVFLSCTNLKTLSVIDEIETAVSKPVLSSNQVLIWHMCKLAGVDIKLDRPFGRLFRSQS